MLSWEGGGEEEAMAGLTRVKRDVFVREDNPYITYNMAGAIGASCLPWGKGREGGGEVEGGVRALVGGESSMLFKNRQGERGRARGGERQ
jgi:hypothetical protein